MATGSGTNFSTTPSMGLFQPTPGVCGPLGVEPAGKSWLELLNSSLGMVDGHTHAPGFGSQVPTAGLNINADLSFGGFNATALRTARFTAQSLGGLGMSDAGCLLVSGLDLYYVDGVGNQVRITSGGGVAGTPGSISGLVGPASATYTPASKLFTFLSSAPRVASLSCGPLSIGDASVDNGKAATISAPAGLAGNYSMTLPGALPGSTLPLSLSAAGAISAAQITTAQIAAGAITNAVQNFGTPSANTDVAIKSYVDNKFICAGQVNSGGTIVAQLGTVTASVVRNSAGDYTVTIAGLTTSGIVLTTVLAANLIGGVVSLASGSFHVVIDTPSFVATDCAFCFTVLKL